MGKEVQIYFPEVGEQLDPPPQKKRTQQKYVRWREGKGIWALRTMCKGEQWEGLWSIE